MLMGAKGSACDAQQHADEQQREEWSRADGRSGDVLEPGHVRPPFIGACRSVGCFPASLRSLYFGFTFLTTVPSTSLVSKGRVKTGKKRCGEMVPKRVDHEERRRESSCSPPYSRPIWSACLLAARSDAPVRRSRVWRPLPSGLAVSRTDQHVWVLSGSISKR